MNKENPAPETKEQKEKREQKELNWLISLAKKYVWASPQTRKKIQAHDVNVIPGNFYSDVPLIKDIEDSFEYRNGPDALMYDKIFNDEEILDFYKNISIYAEEFDPPTGSDGLDGTQYYWDNPAFSFADAMAYYCILRHVKPKAILEVGSGYSTLVANQALLKNGFGKIKIIEPYPMEFLSRLETVDEIIKRFAQDIAVPDFLRILDDVQLWFIDSTHTVKIGSDCLYLYLKVMPYIKKKMMVHTHDVYLPYGMPKEKALNHHVYWTEQYLLYAYLLDNPKAKTLFGSVYLRKKFPELMETFMGGKFSGGGASFWYSIN